MYLTNKKEFKMAQPEQSKGKSLYERVRDYESFVKKV